MKGRIGSVVQGPRNTAETEGLSGHSAACDDAGRAVGAVARTRMRTCVPWTGAG